MRNPAAAKRAARNILGNALGGVPAFEQRQPWAPRRDDAREFASAHELAAWAATRQGREMGKRGTKLGEHRTRDFYLAVAVWRLAEKFDLKPTTRIAGTKCGCALVAEVAREMGIPGVSYHTVRKAWERFKHLR